MRRRQKSETGKYRSHIRFTSYPSRSFKFTSVKRSDLLRRMAIENLVERGPSVCDRGAQLKREEL